MSVGFIGGRTRPLERIVLYQSGRSLNAWSSVGDSIADTVDGQHLWCEVQLFQPGRFGLSLYFVNPERRSARNQEKPRDHLVEIFSDTPVTPPIPKGDYWREFGKRADEWAIQSEPLAGSRVLDFGDGVSKRFELAGPGTYLVKIDKNYSRKIDLCAVWIDRLGTNVSPTSIPEMSTKQTPYLVP